MEEWEPGLDVSGELSPEDGLRALIASSVVQLRKCKDHGRFFSTLQISLHDRAKPATALRSPTSVHWKTEDRSWKQDSAREGRRSLVDRELSTQPSPETNWSSLSPTSPSKQLFSTPRKTITPPSRNLIPTLQRELRQAHAQYHRLETLYSQLLTEQEQKPRTSYKRKLIELKSKLAKDSVLCTQRVWKQECAQLQQAAEAKAVECQALQQRLRGDSLGVLQREVEMLKARVERTEALAAQPSA